jgi:O-acetyl-ADP-ribose deacetylase (regulator of RNase III)
MRISRTFDTLNYHVHKRAGRRMKQELKASGKVKPGQVTLTSGYNLPATYVIHAARPHYSGASKGMGQFNILTECYRSALRMAVAQGIKTLAFPTLGAGGCGFPSRVAARIAIQEVREFLDTNHSVYKFDRIVFCVYNATDEKAYKDLLPVCRWSRARFLAALVLI